MIRINLLRNRIGNNNAEAPVMESGFANSSSRDSLVKLALIAGFTVVLIVLESSNVRRLNQEQARVTEQLTQLQTEAATKATEAEAVKDIEAQAKELQDKLKIIKLLSKLRLREVKTLDFMQTSIPEKVWLTALNYAADKDRFEDGQLTFTGSALATEDLTEFVKRLENSAYLEQVIVVKNQEVDSGKLVGARDFLFTAEVENNQ